MEMLEGLSLTDLIISMKDKQEYFEESRVWHIFTQLIVALRYLHREKCILHRDLSSNNIMVDEGDKVRTILSLGIVRLRPSRSVFFSTRYLMNMATEDRSSMIQQFSSIFFFSCAYLVVENDAIHQPAYLFELFMPSLL